MSAQIDFCEEIYIRPAGLDTIENGGNSFGGSVHVDDSVVIIGASTDHVADFWAGAAYIYELQNGEWQETAKLYANDPDRSDEFGSNVHINGNTALVGATLHDHGDVTNMGAVYVYEKLNGTWTFIQELVASDGKAGTVFGVSMEMEGNTIVVGAAGDDENGEYAGATYIFEKSNGVWVETQKLTASDGMERDLFGVDVSIDNDVLVIGAWGKSDVFLRAGAAYVFEKTNGTWTEVAKLLPNSPSREGSFGLRCNIQQNTIFISASPRITTGKVYVYERPQSGWSDNTETAILSASSGGGRFGLSLDFDGKYIIIGAEDYLNNGVRHGTAYVFEKPVAGWTTTTEDIRLIPSSPGEEYKFGDAVSVSGKYFVVGSSRDRSVDSRFSGSVYIYKNCLHQECLDSMIIAGDSSNGRKIDIGNYRATSIIESSGVVFSPDEVLFSTENNILLNNGFTINKGAVFTAKIADCFNE